jgi:hypothetical protein
VKPLDDKSNAKTPGKQKQRDLIKRESNASKTDPLTQRPVASPPKELVPVVETPPPPPPVELVKVYDPNTFPSLVDKWMAEATAKIFRVSDIYFEKHAARQGGVRKKNLIPFPRSAFMQKVEEELKVFKERAMETCSVHCQRITI